MSTCYCDDFETPSFIRVSTPVSRAQRPCSECGSPILKGERYERVTGVWDHELRTFSTCPDCVELRDHLSDRECFCWGYGGLWEAVGEQFEYADFKIGERFAYLRMVAQHRVTKRRRARQQPHAVQQPRIDR